MLSAVLQKALAQGHLRAAILGGLFLASVALIGLGLVERELQAFRAAAEDDAFRFAETAVRVHSEQVQRTLEAITTLHLLGQVIRVNEALLSGGGALLEQHLREIISRGHFAVLQVALISELGVLVWSTVPDFQPIDLSDRDHFVVHREGRSGPYVSVPLIGRASGRQSVQVTRPIWTPERGFQGVVVVSLDPAELSAGLADRSGTAILLRDEGTVLAHSTDHHGAIGGQPAASLLERLRAAQAASASGVASFKHQGPGGEEFIVAARAVPDWPLTVVYSVEHAPTRAAEEHRRSAYYLVLAATLCVLLILLVAYSAIVSRQSARREAGQAEVARREVMDMLDALPGAAYQAYLDEAGNLLRLELSSATARVRGAEVAGGTSFGSGLPIKPDRLAFLQEVIRCGEASTEYRVELHDGRMRWLRDQCRVARRDNPAGVRVVGILSDITAEREIKAQAISTAKLATLGEMATGIAHEFSQPCAAISLAADAASLTLLSGEANSQLRAMRLLDEVAEQTVRLRDVVDHFRLFARSDEGEWDSLSLVQVVKGALMIARGTLHAAGIRVDLDLTPDLPPVRGRLIPLEQVIVNILVNARDAMEDTPQANRAVTIRAWDSLQDGRVCVAVRDCGTGVALDHLDRVFEPFFTTKRQGRGTGLGLSISYATINSFGGEIAIANCADGGAEVILRLQRDQTAFARSPLGTQTE